MSATVLERTSAANQGGQGAVQAGVTQKQLVRAKAGQRVAVRQRWTNCYLNATSTPLGNPIVEGPYLRIHPMTGLTDVPDQINTFDMRKQVRPLRFSGVRAGEVFSSEGGAITIPQAYGDWYYEINANGPSVYLPFDASVELVAPASGVWVYDLITYDDPFPSQEAQRYHRLTRNIYNENTRVLIVPTGCYAWEVTGPIGASTFSIGLEDTSKAAASGNTIFPVVPVQGQILSIGNARTLTVSQVGVLPAALQIHFHIAIP